MNNLQTLRSQIRVEWIPLSGEPSEASAVALAHEKNREIREKKFVVLQKRSVDLFS